MIVVTGAAGLIGSNIVKGLNKEGHTDILVVDDLSRAEKIKNLSDCVFVDYMDKAEFLLRIKTTQFDQKISVIFHQGACSDTMASDGQYVMENNFTYTKALYKYCQAHNAQLIYASSASVYGSSSEFKEVPENEQPLNAYAFSKWTFDNYLRQQKPKSQAVGLRYFNVYGPREQHKGRMASVAYHFFHQYMENGYVNLFEGCDGYENGGQLRDFVSVEDVVKINLYMMKNPKIQGFYNTGTGEARSFNDVAINVINTLRVCLNTGPSISISDAKAMNLIRYVPMPKALDGKYQSYTQAHIAKLRTAKYKKPLLSVEEGVKRYVTELWKHYNKPKH